MIKPFEILSKLVFDSLKDYSDIEIFNNEDYSEIIVPMNDNGKIPGKIIIRFENDDKEDFVRMYTFYYLYNNSNHRNRVGLYSRFLFNDVDYAMLTITARIDLINNYYETALNIKKNISKKYSPLIINILKQIV